VNDAVIALQMGDMKIFGKLMYASHQSLKELYEVTGKELDTIVEFCKTFDGCIGARMTGAGFGGCAIALIKKNRIDDFEVKLKEHYKKEIGYFPDVFVSGAEDGVKEIKL
jgi:galactokinase